MLFYPSFKAQVWFGEEDTSACVRMFVVRCADFHSVDTSVDGQRAFAKETVLD